MASAILSPMQLRNARLLLGWSRDRLAPLIGISTHTLGKLERGDAGGLDAVLASARSLFDDAGFEFTDERPPGLRLRPAHAQPLDDARR